MKATEHQEAVALMKWVKLSMGKYPDLKHLFHIPNGGNRNIVTARKLKAEGVKRGVSDYFLPVIKWEPVLRGREPCPLWFGLWLELKPQGGYPVPEQHEFMNDMRDQDYAAYWCMGWEEAKQILIDYLEPLSGPSGRSPKPRGTYKLK